jgi:hypothetical protein
MADFERLTHDQAVRAVAAGVYGYDLEFCPVCDDMIVSSTDASAELARHRSQRHEPPPPLPTRSRWERIMADDEGDT